MDQLELPPTLRTIITVEDDGALSINQFSDGEEQIIYLAPDQAIRLAGFLSEAVGSSRAG